MGHRRSVARSQTTNRFPRVVAGNVTPTRVLSLAVKENVPPCKGCVLPASCVTLSAPPIIGKSKRTRSRSVGPEYSSSAKRPIARGVGCGSWEVDVMNPEQVKLALAEAEVVERPLPALDEGRRVGRDRRDGRVSADGRRQHEERARGGDRRARRGPGQREGKRRGHGLRGGRPPWPTLSRFGPGRPAAPSPHEQQRRRERCWQHDCQRDRDAAKAGGHVRPYLTSVGKTPVGARAHSEKGCTARFEFK